MSINFFEEPGHSQWLGLVVALFLLIAIYRSRSSIKLLKLFARLAYGTWFAGCAFTLIVSMFSRSLGFSVLGLGLLTGSFFATVAAFRGDAIRVDLNG